MSSYKHEDRDNDGEIPPLEQPVFGAKFFKPAPLHAGIVRLTFKRGGERQSGNGFFVHLPGAKRDVVLTAGHNLFSNKPHTDLRVRLFNSPDEIAIPNGDVRYSEGWKNRPEQPCAAQDDYGVILLPAGTKAPGDFGFSLPLGIEERLDCKLSVTGYRASTSPGEPPATSTGACINPIIRPNQLEYLIEGEAGLSGSPVWVGYKGHPTVVAIHNYDRTIRKPGYGSKATRLNLKSMLDILAWAGVDTSARLLRVVASGPDTNTPLEPPLRLACSPHDGRFRVVVDDVDDPPAATMLVRVFPVYTTPRCERSNAATTPRFGFMMAQTPASRPAWISWNPPPAASASRVADLRRAWLARLDGERWDCGGDFAVVVALRPGEREEQMVTVEYGGLAGWRLEEPGEVLDVVGYRRFAPGQRQIEGAYHRWVLESYPASE